MTRFRDTMVRTGRGQAIRRGTALLEVVLSIGILLMAMVGVGVVFRNGLHHIEMAERISRSRVATERLIAEIDSKYLNIKEQRELSGYLGEEAPPGFSWRVVVDPHEKINRLATIDIEVLRGGPTASEEERELLYRVRILRPEPKGLDLKEDFGLDDDQIAELTAALPGIVNATDFDVAELLQNVRNLEDLADLLPTLIQAFGTGFMGGEADALLNAAQSGDTQGLLDAASQLQGQGGVQQPGGSSGQQSGPPRRTPIGGGK